MPDQAFVVKYRERHRKDKDLPCLNCTNEQIIKCSNIPIVKRRKFKEVKLGCADFKKYERSLRSTKHE